MQDCSDCQSGVKVAVLKPKTEVIFYAQRKSTRGRTKQRKSQGHACPNPKCDYFGVSNHFLHAIAADGKRGIDKNIQYGTSSALIFHSCVNAKMPTDVQSEGVLGIKRKMLVSPGFSAA